MINGSLFLNINIPVCLVHTYEHPQSFDLSSARYKHAVCSICKAFSYTPQTGENKKLSESLVIKTF